MSSDAEEKFRKLAQKWRKEKDRIVNGCSEIVNSTLTKDEVLMMKICTEQAIYELEKVINEVYGE